MVPFCKIFRVTAWMGVLIAAQAAAQLQPLNHSFNVDLSSGTICLDGAAFVGQPTRAESLDLLMTAQIFDAAGATLLASGNTHTFKKVGEQFGFLVLYPVGTFNPGDMAGVSVSDIPGTIGGVEGFFDEAPVGDCLLPLAPAMPQWGLAALLVLLAGTGVAFTRRTRLSA